MRAPGETTAVAWTSTCPTASFPRNDHGADLGLRDQYAIDHGLGFVAADGAAPVDFSDVKLNLVAGAGGLAKLRFVDGEHQDNAFADAGAAVVRNDNGPCSLSHGLDDQYAGENRLVREMTLKHRLVIGNVLDAGRALVAIDVDDAIDHQKRIAVRQRLEDVRDFKCGELAPGRLVGNHGVVHQRRSPLLSLRRVATSRQKSLKLCAGAPATSLPAGISVATAARPRTTVPAPMVRWPLVPAPPPIRTPSSSTVEPESPAWPAIRQ